MHRANQVQNFLEQKLKSRFVKNIDWPLKLLDCNPLDYYFWYRVQEKVNKRRYYYPFTTIDELKRRICDVWDECSTDLPPNAERNQTVSPPFGSCWRERRRLSQNCFRIDINKQIIYWKLCRYLIFMKSLYHNFLLIRWSLTKKGNLK